MNATRPHQWYARFYNNQTSFISSRPQSIGTKQNGVTGGGGGQRNGSALDSKKVKSYLAKPSKGCRLKPDISQRSLFFSFFFLLGGGGVLLSALIIRLSILTNVHSHKCPFS